MLKRVLSISALCSLLVIMGVSGAEAAWVPDGVAVTPLLDPPDPVPGYRFDPSIIPDGYGGAIITWADSRNGDSDIYTQRVDANGRFLWTAGGIAICTAWNNQGLPQITSDGSGGAIITWQDGRSGSNWDIYAQRVDANGDIHIGWAANGVAICAAGNP